MAKANTCMWTERTTKVNGSTTSIMGMEKKCGPMVLFLKATTIWEKNKAVASSSGPMAAHFQATLAETKWRATAFISGLMVESIRVSGKIISSTVMATLLGMTAESILEAM